MLPLLLKSGLDLTILSREGSSAAFPQEAKVIKSDFSEESLVQALKGQDAVVSMLPIMALGEQAKVAEAAIKAGVKRFIPSEYGSDSSAGDFVTSPQSWLLLTVIFKSLRMSLQPCHSSRPRRLSWIG